MPPVRHGMNVIRKTLGSVGRLISERFGKRDDPFPLGAGNNKVNVVRVPLISPRTYRQAACDGPPNLLALEKLRERGQHLGELHSPRIPRGPPHTMGRPAS